MFFFFKQKTAYEMRISDWSSDVCSSDLMADAGRSDCQGACVPMGKRTAQPSAAAASDNAARVQLGPYWLEYRAQRDDWSICWYDPGARTRRRRKTGLGGSGRPDPLAEIGRGCRWGRG